MNEIQRYRISSLAQFNTTVNHAANIKHDRMNNLNQNKTNTQHYYVHEFSQHQMEINKMTAACRNEIFIQHSGMQRISSI